MSIAAGAVASVEDSLATDFIADGLGVVASGRDVEEHRLRTSVAGTLGHNVMEFPVWLRMQLVEDNSVGVEAVLVANVRGKNLVDTTRR